MTTPTDRNTELAEAGLFEDLPQPSQAQVEQAQAKMTSKQGQGAPSPLGVGLRGAPGLESVDRIDQGARQQRRPCSGREVARLSQEHDAYRWICGGVSVNYHGLNDFRAGNVELMDELLTDNVAALAAAGATGDYGIRGKTLKGMILRMWQEMSSPIFPVGLGRPALLQATWVTGPYASHRIPTSPVKSGNFSLPHP